jgi:hypothetical protein
MKKVDTFTADIYLGFRHGYSDRFSSVDEVRAWVQNYCNEQKIGVTFTPTEFIYTDGNESGVIIGLINYPRFPKAKETIKYMAMIIAQSLMRLCHQERVSVVFSDETVMFEKEDS